MLSNQNRGQAKLNRTAVVIHILLDKVLNGNSQQAGVAIPVSK